MIPHDIFQGCKSIICLNGLLPKAEFFNSELPIIAADGAANQLLKIGIRPDIVIGDLDSFKSESYPDINTIKIIDQDRNDFEKSLAYAKQQGLSPSLILGLDGGFIDHILNNINIIIDNNCRFYTEGLTGEIHCDSSASYTLKNNTKISIFGMPHAIVSSHGLKWELDNFELNFPGNNSCFNRSISDVITIDVKKGKILTIIYLNEENDLGNDI